MVWLTSSQDSDQAAFQSIHVLLAGGIFLLYLLALFVPVCLVILDHNWAIAVLPLPLLLLNLTLSLSAVGRGAMWTFGRGHSPASQLAAQTVLLIVCMIAYVAMRSAAI